MSMVATFVQSREGNWYRNPVIEGDGWYICWDDDDPIEIVVSVTSRRKISDILTQLAEQGWKLETISKPFRGASRLFKGKFAAAESQFLRQLNNGPTTEMLKGSTPLFTKPRGEGVFYENSPNGNGGYF